jgi:hypothetical protein
MLVVLPIDGVFSTQPDLKTATARRGSILLYEALSSQYDLIALGQGDIEFLRWWLRKERMPKCASLRGWTEENFFLYRDWKIHEVGNFLSAGWEIALYLDNDSYVVGQVAQLGVTAGRLTHPLNGPGFRDLTEAPRAWSDVASSVETTGGSDGNR